MRVLGLSEDVTEHTFLIVNPELQREQDLAFRIETARATGFDTIDRECREPRFPREFSLAHHQPLPELLQLVGRHASPSANDTVQP
jgi:hypothetical protein